MTLVKVNPRKAACARPVHNPFNQLFNDFFNTSLSDLNDHDVTHTKPGANIMDYGEGYRIDLALPGMDKKDIDLNVDNHLLTVKANKVAESSEGETFRRREFKYGTFKRTFRLPETIDHGQIAASMKHGVLEITLPKKEEALPKAPVQVKVK